MMEKCLGNRWIETKENEKKREGQIRDRKRREKEAVKESMTERESDLFSVSLLCFWKKRHKKITSNHNDLLTSRTTVFTGNHAAAAKSGPKR